MKLSVRIMTSLISLAILVGFTAPYGLAFPPLYPTSSDGTVKQFMEERRELMYEKLNLTPEQQERLNSQRAKHREQAILLYKSNRQIREELRNELQKLKLDMPKIQKLHEALKDIQGRLADQRLAGILEVREILTPEQFSRFIDFAGKHGTRMGKRRGPPTDMTDKGPREETPDE